MELNIEHLRELVAEHDLQRFAEALPCAATTSGYERISFTPSSGSSETVVELCMSSTGKVLFRFTIPRGFSEDFQGELFGAFCGAIKRWAGWEDPFVPTVGREWRVVRRTSQSEHHQGPGRSRENSSQLVVGGLQPPYARDAPPPTKPSGG